MPAWSIASWRQTPIGSPPSPPRRSGGWSTAALCFGVYGPERTQIGFARVVTDRVTRAWLCDLFILKEARGRGLGKWLVRCIMAHPELQGLRRWILATSDAHELYRPFGFTVLAEPERMMEYKPPPSR